MRPPAQVPNLRHVGFGAHEATPKQVGFPCIVAGTHRIAQLAIAIVGGQLMSPGQLGEPSHVTQLAARQLSNPGNVGGGGTSSQLTASHELKFDHVMHAGPFAQLTLPSMVMHEPAGHVLYPEYVGHNHCPGQLACAMEVGQAPSPHVYEPCEVGQPQSALSQE